MSAFIVQKTTINKILSWLGREFLNNRYLQELARQFGVDVVSDGWEQKLAKEMYSLNVTAVNQRYKEKNPVSEIVYSPCPYSSRIAAWKALVCWLYQCSEEDVPQTKLYRFFEEIEKQTACCIVRDLPKYEQASWG